MPDLAAALRTALPSGVVPGQGQAGTPPWPGEHLPGATPARLAEFALGRSAARDAMRALGVPPAAIPMRDDRSPDWPAGLTGSISHCAGACFAILADRGRFAGLGLDLEPRRPLSPDLWPVILRPEEADTADPLAVFVAKEAAYKAQYALTGALFDFQGLAVTLSDSGFAARFCLDAGVMARGHVLHGRLLRTARHIAAICVITAS